MLTVLSIILLIIRNDNPRYKYVLDEYTKTVQLLSQKPE